MTNTYRDIFAGFLAPCSGDSTYSFRFVCVLLGVGNFKIDKLRGDFLFELGAFVVSFCDFDGVVEKENFTFIGVLWPLLVLRGVDLGLRLLDLLSELRTLNLRGVLRDRPSLEAWF